MPLLHPAHAVAPGHVSGALGASGHFVLGDVSNALERADAAGPSVDSEAVERTAAGVLASVLGEPAVAPFVAARAGVARDLEAGLAYSGRSLRLDGRYVRQARYTAISGGLGFELVTAHPSKSQDGQPTSPSLSGVDTSGVSGWAVSLPVLVGYRSDAELVQVWGGVRGRYEHANGEVGLALESSPSAEISGRGISAQALVGLAVGLPPIWVAAEVSVGYLDIKGDFEPASGPSTSASLGGMTVSPAGALLVRF